MPLKFMIAAYDFYEILVERLLNEMTAMMVNLVCTDGIICMNIQMGCQEEIAQQVLDGIELPFGSFRYELMEEDVVIDLTIAEGGGAR
jgi:hypothetical protein